MNTIMGVCADCGKMLSFGGARLCWSCKDKYRVCCVCGFWYKKTSMTQDAKLQYPYYVGSDYRKWVCLGCASGRQKASV